MGADYPHLFRVIVQLVLSVGVAGFIPGALITIVMIPNAMLERGLGGSILGVLGGPGILLGVAMLFLSIFVSPIVIASRTTLRKFV